MTKTHIYLTIMMFLAAIIPNRSMAMEDDLIRVSSPHSVSQTIDNLSTAIEAAGAKVFARINHAAGAKSVGMEIPDNEVLIFGNPALGTPIISDAPAAGLDLPMRVAAYKSDAGTVMIYHNPKILAASLGLAEDHPSIMKITGALANLTAKAAE